MLLISFLILPHATLAQTQPQDVVEISPFCFRKAECQTYNASPSPYVAPECQNPSPGHNAKAVELEYKYNCYANQQEIKLQVSIGGYKVTGIENYIRRLYVYFVNIAGIVAGIMIVWAGTKWLTSAGAPEKITDAKKKIGNAVLGLVLILGSYVILQTVNPALVSFKLPPVKIVRQELGETQAWCVKRTEFPCGGDAQHADGKWQCSDPAYLDNPPCSGQAGGTGACYGQYCAEGGCQRIVMERFRSLVSVSELRPQLTAISRKCFDPARCNNCNIPLSAEGLEGQELLNNVALCISTACNCLITSTSSSGVTTVNEDFKCQPLQNPGEECHSDAECKSGNCVMDRTIQRCTQQGGNPNGGECGQDEDCRSGLCNKNVAPNKCVGRGSIPNGQDCSRSTECQSGICGYSSEIANWTPTIDPVCLSSGRQCEFNASRCNAD